MERISIRNLRKLVGRKFADWAQVEPIRVTVYDPNWNVIRSRFLLAYRSDRTYHKLPIDTIDRIRDDGTIRPSIDIATECCA